MISKIQISAKDGLLIGAAFNAAKLMEVMVESSGGADNVGHIYMGQVQRVVAGIDGVFVNFGRSRNGFLPIDHGRLTGGFIERPEHVSNGSILQLKQGSWLPVQILRPEVDDKGARLTQKLSFASAYLVFFPAGEGVAVSKKIDEPNERARLEWIGQEALLGVGGGLMFRTLAQTVTEELLVADIQRLLRQWEKVRAARDEPNVVRCLHQVASSPLLWVEKWLSTEVRQIVVDDNLIADQIKNYLEAVMPDRVQAVSTVASSVQAQFRLGLVELLDRLMSARVPLPSGGYLFIEETQAMSTVDVNSGAGIGEADLAMTALKTNLEAARQIPRELQLRHLAGLVAIDFIDMVDPTHQSQVRDCLLRACRDDGVHCRVSGFSEFGVVQVSRAQHGLSLSKRLHSSDSFQSVSAPQRHSLRTAVTDITSQARDAAKAYPEASITVFASAPVLSALLAERASSLALEAIGKVLTFQIDSESTQHEVYVGGRLIDAEDHGDVSD